LPVTLLLNFLSIVVVYVISVPLGIYSALHPTSVFDKIATFLLFLMYSLPSFWIAMLLIMYFGGGDYLNLFPIVGLISPGFDQLPLLGKIGNVVWHLVLPVVVLTYAELAFLSRFSRAQLLEVVRQDYVRTARAKGLPERTVIFKHALRNALIPFVTMMGGLLPAMIGGSVVVEQIFSIPGMGNLGFEAVLSRDYPTVMAIAAIEAMLTLVGLLISDVLYVIVDPRISFEKCKGEVTSPYANPYEPIPYPATVREEEIGHSGLGRGDRALRRGLPGALLKPPIRRRPTIWTRS
jgi:peptide/nickel transport system permease protein